MKFSILIPTRNRLNLLQLAIASVLRQDYPDFEVIISDNDSDQPVREYIQSIGDSRILYTRTSRPLHVTDNWNNALARASGDYIIMLGDDDALCTGCLGTLSLLIDEWGRPDCIYSGAYIFTYKGVVSGTDYCQVHENRNAIFWKGTDRPYVLSREYRLRLVNDSMSLFASYGFNMQYVTVSRHVIAKVTGGKDFFQTQYPDYFAMNNLLLNVERFLVIEKPLVVIGVSRSSFGWYFQNRKEGAGNQVLCIASSMDAANSGLESVVLPGTTMNTNWLTSMMRLYEANRDVVGLEPPNIRRYRFKQIVYCALLRALGEFDADSLGRLEEKLERGEMFVHRVLQLLARSGGVGQRVLATLHVVSQKRMLYMIRALSKLTIHRRPAPRFAKDHTVLDAEQLLGN